jgi:hypothetical protein
MIKQFVTNLRNRDSATITAVNNFFIRGMFALAIAFGVTVSGLTVAAFAAPSQSEIVEYSKTAHMQYPIDWSKVALQHTDLHQISKRMECTDWQPHTSSTGEAQGKRVCKIPGTK